MKRAGMLCFFVLTWVFAGRPAAAYLGQVKGYAVPGAVNVSTGEIVESKIMMDTGSYKVSVVYLNLFADPAKVRVRGVSVNRQNFPNVFIEKESGGTISVYGASTKSSDQLPRGVVEIGTVSLETVNPGVVEISTSSFEITGPSATADYNYEWKWQKPSINISDEVAMPTEAPIGGNGNNGILKFKMAFTGVTSQAMCAGNWPVTMVVMSQSRSQSYQNISVSPTGEDVGLKVYQGELLLEGIGELNNLAVFIKGPRHLQVKYGENGQNSFYNQPGGKIAVDKNPSNTPVYDFSKYPLPAGDVTGANGSQDGSVDGLDFSYVKREVNKRSEGDNLLADLNGNCKLESQDLTLLMLAMKERQEQLY